MNSRIRIASLADIDAVGHCLVAAFEPYRARYSAAAFADTVPSRDGLVKRFSEMTVLVAEDETGNVVGTVAHSCTGSDGHIRGMAVLPHAHGSGVAAALLGAAEDGIAARGCVRVTLDTTAPLERAIRFYERRGYRATGRIDDFYGMPLYEYARDLPRS